VSECVIEIKYHKLFLGLNSLSYLCVGYSVNTIILLLPSILQNSSKNNALVGEYKCWPACAYNNKPCLQFSMAINFTDNNAVFRTYNIEYAVANQQHINGRIIQLN
jgi:hypothetical protein